MLNRIIIHTKNLYLSLKWIIFEFNQFKKHLESKGYYSTIPYRLFLWKENAKYFRSFNNKGECFFIKMKSKENVIYESEVIEYVLKNNLEGIKSFPEICDTIISDYSYNIFKDLEGSEINKKLVLEFDLVKQMLTITSFFHRIKIIHRDIRPHNLLVVDGVIKVLDFEHSVIDKKKHHSDSKELNKQFRPQDDEWDDAYSFKFFLDKFLEINKNEKEYLKLSKMVNQYVYKIN